MKHMRAMLAGVLAVLLSGCGDEPAPGTSQRGDLLVYESRQAIQCGSRGLTTQQSAQKLVNGGIDVLESNCGVMTGVAFAAVCGIGNGDILIHKVRRENLADAEQLGFSSVDTLRDPVAGIGYAKVDCDTG